MEYRHLIGNPRYRAIWRKSYGNELGSLAQGIPGRVKGTDTIFFIDKTDIPVDLWNDVTHRRIVVSYRLEKSNANCTRLTVSGDRVNYPGYCGTPTTDLLTVKLLINITISTPGACFMTININYFTS